MAIRHQLVVCRVDTNLANIHDAHRWDQSLFHGRMTEALSHTTQPTRPSRDTFRREVQKFGFQWLKMGEGKYRCWERAQGAPPTFYAFIRARDFSLVKW